MHAGNIGSDAAQVQRVKLTQELRNRGFSPNTAGLPAPGAPGNPRTVVEAQKHENSHKSSLYDSLKDDYWQAQYGHPNVIATLLQKYNIPQSQPVGTIQVFNPFENAPNPFDEEILPERGINPFEDTLDETEDKIAALRTHLPQNNAIFTERDKMLKQGVAIPSEMQQKLNEYAVTSLEIQELMKQKDKLSASQPGYNPSQRLYHNLHQKALDYPGGAIGTVKYPYMAKWNMDSAHDFEQAQRELHQAGKDIKEGKPARLGSLAYEIYKTSYQQHTGQLWYG